jgi:hypothetical protein
MEVAAGAICLLAALIVLLEAVVVGITRLGLDAGWAALIVGVVVAIIGAILVRRGTTNLSVSNLAPERTVDQVQQDIKVGREQVR